MTRIIIMLLPRKKEAAAESGRKPRTGESLAHFWLVEGRRAYRESVIGDKIDREAWKHLDAGMWF